MSGRVGLSYVPRLARVRLSNKTIAIAAAEIALAATVSPTLGRAQDFRGLGTLPGYDVSFATGISADGSTVVGDSARTGSTQAFGWTNAGGMTSLGTFAGDTRASGANGDGSVVVGYLTSGINTQAFRWTSTTGAVGLGTLGGGSSVANGVNGDGTVVVGTSGIAPTALNHAFRWTNAGGLQDIGTLGGQESFANGVSGDGSVVVGVSNAAVGGNPLHAFAWTSAGGMRDLGTLGTSSTSTSGANGVSGDGSVVVGSSNNGGGSLDRAFRWTSAGGMQDLGTLGNLSGTVAFATNFDGSVVVGGSSNLAFRWTAPLGMQSVQDILLANGVSLAGWTILQQASGVSSDGTVITGLGEHSGSLEAWVAQIPVNAFAFLDLQGANHSLGSLVWGGTVTNSASGSPAALSVGSDNTSTIFKGSIQDGNSPSALTKTGTGTLTLTGANSYSGTTTLALGTIAGGAENAFSPNSAFNVASGAVLDLGGFNQTIGSLAGAGTVTNTGVSGPKTLTAGGDNGSTTFGGNIQDGPNPTAFSKAGFGTLILSGANTYTGTTTINGGALEVNGSIASSSLTTVNANGVLTGTGSVGNTTVASGGTLLPGNGTPGSSLTVAGNLAFQSGALYLVQLNPATSTFTSITGTATLGGAAVGAVYANGTYVSKQYTILTTTGGVNGTFSGLVNTNLPTNFSAALNYDPKNVYLDLTLNFTPTPSGPNFGGGLNMNQQNVANSLVNFFNATGGIPLVFGGLSPAGLTQASGELATGSQQATFDAMGLFMGLLTDPFMNRSGNGTGGAGATPFAEEASAYASNGRPRTNSERDAYAAMYSKAPPAAPFVPSWSVWAAGYGGSQTTDGNAALGSNNTSSSIAGTAVGADYRFSPYTLAGFALAGGGTNFSVSGFGTGRSDLFQAGAYVRHMQGPAYISAALAYGWQDITTNRTVTVAGIDQLQARFNANAYSGRAEGGYRFATPWMGVTPYAAAQFTTFDLPAYAEQAIVGSNMFALAYGARDVTDTRSELGIRTDKSFAMTNSILTLRGRFAWAHDFDPDRNIGATFQALPGASFVVNGAAQAHDSALTTASAEMKWMNGWSAAATFEGEFSQVTRSYAGKGVARYSW